MEFKWWGDSVPADATDNRTGPLTPGRNIQDSDKSFIQGQQKNPPHTSKLAGSSSTSSISQQLPPEVTPASILRSCSKSYRPPWATEEDFEAAAAAMEAAAAAVEAKKAAAKAKAARRSAPPLDRRPWQDVAPPPQAFNFEGHSSHQYQNDVPSDMALQSCPGDDISVAAAHHNPAGSNIQIQQQQQPARHRRSRGALLVEDAGSRKDSAPGYSGSSLPRAVMEVDELPCGDLGPAVARSRSTTSRPSPSARQPKLSFGGSSSKAFSTFTQSNKSITSTPPPATSMSKGPAGSGSTRRISSSGWEEAPSHSNSILSAAGKQPVKSGSRGESRIRSPPMHPDKHEDDNISFGTMDESTTSLEATFRGSTSMMMRPQEAVHTSNTSHHRSETEAVVKSSVRQTLSEPQRQSAGFADTAAAEMADFSFSPSAGTPNSSSRSSSSRLQPAARLQHNDLPPPPGAMTGRRKLSGHLPSTSITTAEYRSHDMVVEGALAGADDETAESMMMMMRHAAAVGSAGGSDSRQVCVALIGPSSAAAAAAGRLDALSAAALKEENRALQAEVLHLREVLGAVQGGGFNGSATSCNATMNTSASSNVSFNNKIASAQLRSYQEGVVKQSRGPSPGFPAAPELSAVRRYKAQTVQLQRQIALLSEELQVRGQLVTEAESALLDITTKLEDILRLPAAAVHGTASRGANSSPNNSTAFIRRESTATDAKQTSKSPQGGGAHQPHMLATRHHHHKMTGAITSKEQQGDGHQPATDQNALLDEDGSLLILAADSCKELYRFSRQALARIKGERAQAAKLLMKSGQAERRSAISGGYGGGLRWELPFIPAGGNRFLAESTRSNNNDLVAVGSASSVKGHHHSSQEPPLTTPAGTPLLHLVSSAAPVLLHFPSLTHIVAGGGYGGDATGRHHPLLHLIQVASGACMPSSTERLDNQQADGYIASGLLFDNRATGRLGGTDGMALASAHLHTLERQMLELGPRLSTLTVLLKTLILPAMPWLSIEASEKVQSEASHAAAAAAAAARPLMELVSLLPAVPLTASGAAGSLSETSRVGASMSSGRDAWLWSQQGSSDGEAPHFKVLVNQDYVGQLGQDVLQTQPSEAALHRGMISSVLDVDMEELAAVIAQAVLPSGSARKVSVMQALKEVLQRSLVPRMRAASTCLDKLQQELSFCCKATSLQSQQVSNISLSLVESIESITNSNTSADVPPEGQSLSAVLPVVSSVLRDLVLALEALGRPTVHTSSDLHDSTIRDLVSELYRLKPQLIKLPEVLEDVHRDSIELRAQLLKRLASLQPSFSRALGNQHGSRNGSCLGLNKPRSMRSNSQTALESRRSP